MTLFNERGIMSFYQEQIDQLLDENEQLRKDLLAMKAVAASPKNVNVRGRVKLDPINIYYCAVMGTLGAIATLGGCWLVSLAIGYFTNLF